MLKWKQLKTDSYPSPRRRMTLTTYNHNIYLYGGFDERILGELYIFDTITNKWEKITTETSPCKRSGHTSVTYGNHMVVFAGEGELQNRYFSLNDVWMLNYDTKEWKEIIIENEIFKPIQRYFHSSTIFEDSMIIYGGYDGLEAFNDLYEFSLKDFKWKKCYQFGERPPKMLSHSSVSLYPSIYVYGGIHNLDTTKTDGHELYEYNFLSYTWKKIVCNFYPPRRCNVSIAQVNNQFYFFGGYDESSKKYNDDEERFFNDLYLFQIREYKWKEININDGPSRRTKHAFIHSNGRLYLFGGLDKNEQNRNDLYMIDISQDSIHSKLKSSLNSNSFSDVLIFNN